MMMEREPDLTEIAELAALERTVVMAACFGHPLPALTDEDLTDVPARAGLQAVRQVLAQRNKVTLFTLTAALRDNGHIEHLRPLMEHDTDIHRGELEEALYRVRQESLIRRTRRSLRHAFEQVERRGRKVRPEELQGLVSGIVSSCFRDIDTGHAAVTDEQVLSELEQFILEGREFEGFVETGFESLDDLAGGWGPGQLIVLGARTSMGKSALGGQIALNVCRSAGPVALVTLEMDRMEVGRRMAAQICQANPRALTPEHVRYARAVQRKGRLHIFDSGRSLQSFVARVATLKMREPDLALVMVDYLTLLQDDRIPKHKTFEQATEVARALKELAAQHRIPICAMAQLSRGVDSRQDKRPVMSDLRNSGEIEEAANQILFIYRPKADDPDTEVIVAKNRSGPTGTVHLRWQESTVSFFDAAQRTDQAPPEWYRDSENRRIPIEDFGIGMEGIV